MGNNVFMTGFPGFIGQRLVGKLLDRDPDTRFTFLIQDNMRGVADAAIKGMEAPYPGFIESTTVLTGDISRRRMGLSKDAYQGVCAETTHVWHLAAVYNLAIPQSVAYQVNVVGTANILDLCEQSHRLQRHDYVSTCFVAGDRTGRVTEAELDKGQGFKNHYESTKCWAELEVRRRMDRIPTAIHRPAVVVGDSRTGETDKYDGPYALISFLNKLPTWLPFVYIGPCQAPINLVPVDFLVDAMAEIWTREDALGKTFHLADPRPHTSGEVLKEILHALGHAGPIATVPHKLVEAALGVDLVRGLMGIPQEQVAYMNHFVSFDTKNQEDLLKGTGIACPDLLDTLPTLIDYLIAHPEKPFLDNRQI